MILCDAGPPVALIDRTDFRHNDCTATLGLLGTEFLLMTWPAMAEAMYLIHRVGGHSAQDELWEYVARGIITIYRPADGESERMRVLMAKYASLPMDLADASLVTAAERTEIHRIFTLDHHFRSYLINDRKPFDIVP